MNAISPSTQAGPSGRRVKFIVWPAVAGIALLSGLISMLYLTGSLFMLEVYDRVLPSRSVPTLVGLGALVLALYAFQGFFDLIRGRLLVRAAIALDGSLRRPIFEAVLAEPLLARTSGDGLQPLRDLDQVRAFLSSPGPAALFDLPWVPIYIALCFAFHFWIGMAALGGAFVLMGLTAMTDLLTRGPTRASARAATVSIGWANAGRQNAEVLRAMGMTSDVASVWERASREHVSTQRRIADVTGGFGSATKVIRLALQSGVLGIGAYLVIRGEATGGIMIASSILLARALAPVEIAVGNWKGFVAARQSWSRLRTCLARVPQQTASVALRAPRKSLTVEAVAVVAPGGDRILVHDANFAVAAGSVLAIAGPSGSGKSCLARALVGVWTPARGKVKLDGASLDQWSAECLGKHVGYLPQDVELFQGTVAQNISRFSAEASSDAVIEAAEAAGVHDLICSFAHGYDTALGEGGTALSAGQRQRIGLARALYGSPFLIVLDEPNSNLDADGEAALLDAIRSARARGAVVVIVAHRQSVLTAVDHVLVLSEGRLKAFGPKDDVLQALRPAGVPDGGTARLARTQGSGPDRGAGQLRIVAEAQRAPS